MADYKQIFDNRIKIKNSITVSSIITMYYYDFTATYRSGLEKHNFWEFVYVDNGRVIVTANDATHVLNKGEMIFHKPNEMHSVKCDGETPANIFIMSFAASGNGMKFFKDRIVNVPYSLQGMLAAIVEEMQTAYGENPGFITREPIKIYGADQIIKNYLESFMILTKRAVESGQTDSSYSKVLQNNVAKTNQLVNNIIEILEANVYENTTIELICQSTNYGKSQLCETFKKVTGKTIMQYYTELKINQAKILMRELQLNNSQISDRLGFSSPQYFARVFKQITSMTPGGYKRSIRYR
ncbi:MAG: helix-turn-helix transcriptional regulator [Clostridia bacterium]|nr:helix-turn-helix transcriptional regulator [Clostridia bacterium]